MSMKKETFEEWMNKNFNRYIEDGKEISNLYYCSPDSIFEQLREDGMVVVPEETWLEQETIIYLLRLEIKAREEEKERIKMLIEAFPNGDDDEAYCAGAFDPA